MPILKHHKIEMPKLYTKKPLTIEAIRWVGDNTNSVDNFCKGKLVCMEFTAREAFLIIKTLEGSMKVSCGDWIIKGIAGEVYPCKPDIFEKTYFPADKENEQ